MSDEKDAPKESPKLTDDALSQINGGLVIEGIKGESQDDKHKDTIEILSFNHSITTPSK